MKEREKERRRERNEASLETVSTMESPTVEEIQSGAERVCVWQRERKCVCEREIVCVIFSTIRAPKGSHLWMIIQTRGGVGGGV